MRVFAGLPLPQDVISGLVKTVEYIKGSGKAMSFVKPEGMHITVKFFGEIEESAAKSIARLMEDPILRIKKIRSRIGGVGRFPRKGNPRVIFVSLDEGVEEVAGFCATYRMLIERLGYAEDKREEFVPHITIARNKSERIKDDFLAAAPINKSEFYFDRLVLYESILTARGAEYTPLTTVMLE
jgi:2'-5' RNA ligase